MGGRRRIQDAAAQGALSLIPGMLTTNSLRRLQLNSLQQLCRRGPTRSRFLLKSQIRSYKLDDALRLSSSFPYLLYAQLLPLQGNTTVTRPFWALELGTLATSPVTPLWLLGLLGTAQVRDGDTTLSLPGANAPW